MKSIRFGLVLVLALGCQLPPSSQVLFRCGADGTCGDGLQCWPDDYCHPLEDGAPPRDAGGNDASFDAGFDAGVADAGTPDAGTPDAGEEDAGFDAGEEDAGFDAGFDAGPCVPLTVCPSGAECGAFDAGCGSILECGSCTAPDECGTQQPNMCALPKLCQQGFCWENPLPQGNTLFAVFAFSPKAVWAVGEAGTVLFWNGERSVLVDVGTTADLRTVFGTGSNEVYVGGDQGTIVHFNGTAWVREQVPGVYRINTIWVAQNGTAFAGANGGSILKRGSGGVWSDMIITNTADVLGIAGLDDGQVFATTFTRPFRLPALNGNTWTAEAVWPGPNRDTLLMTAAGNQLFAGGKISGQNYGQLLERQSDAGWKQYGINVPSGFTSLTATIEGPYLGSPGGTVTKIELDGGLSKGSLVRDGGLYGVYPIALDTVFAVGEWGTMAIVGDAGVRELSYGGVSNVNGLCGYADTRVYGAGNNFSVYERRSSPTGVRWDSVTRTVQNGSNWLSCFADGPDRVWVMSDDRWYLRQVSGVLVQADTGSNQDWTGVWGTAPGPIYFVNEGTQVYWSATGDNPNYVTSTFGAANGIWGVADDDLLVVTSNGQVRAHSTGIFWNDISTPQPSRFLRAVHGRTMSDGGVLYSVVGSGTAWRRVNGTFFADFVDAGHSLRGTYVMPEGDIWAAGDDAGLTLNAPQGRGVIWHYVPDAGAWLPQPPPSARPFNTMTGYGDTGPFIGGAGGAILRKSGADGG